MAITDPIKRLLSELGFLGSIGTLFVGGYLLMREPGTIQFYSGVAVTLTGVAGVAVSQGFLIL